MTEFSQDNNSPPEPGFDGIGCASSLLLFMLIVFIVNAIVSGEANTPVSNGSPAAATTRTAPITATAEQALILVTSTPWPTDTSLPPATYTATATEWLTLPLPTATVTAVPEYTPIVTLPLPLLPTPQGAYSLTLEVPILMYHHIGTLPEGADIYRVDLSVEPNAFREQMTYLAENGYTTIDLYDLSLAIVAKIELPPKPVIITMDDGYRDNYENAFPILKELGLKATFFVLSEVIDRGHDAYMTWDMLKEMAAAAMRIEPHTKTHPDLRGQERDYLIWQILGSQESIAAHIGYMPRYFAYPSGRYDDLTLQIVQELDFWGAVTTVNGNLHGFNDRYEWVRLRVRHSTSLAEFIDLVELGKLKEGELEESAGD